MKCSICGIEKEEKGRLPRGWKRLGEAVQCGACWQKAFLLRAVTIPVAGPIDPKDWPALREALGEAWGDSTRLANWAMTELVKVETVRKPDDKKLGKAPNPYLYPAARKFVPEMSSTSVVAVLNTVQRKYNAARLDVIWRGAASLPSFRYPVPYPLPAQSWSIRYLSDEQKVPVLRVTISSQPFHLRLRGGHEFKRQLRVVDQLIAGQAQPCELALYRVAVSANAERPGVTDRESGGGIKQQFRIMAKLVAWIPRAQPEARNGERVCRLSRGKDCFLVAEVDDRPDPWVLNADHVKRWILSHTERRQRLSQDIKHEKRWPASNRQQTNDFLDLLCRKQNHRIETFSHTATKMLAEFCARQRVTKLIYDESSTEYLPSYPWHALAEMLRYKLGERGIAVETAQTAEGTANDEKH